MCGELFDLASVGSESGERWFFGFGFFSRYIHDHIAAFSQQLFDPNVEVLYTIPMLYSCPNRSGIGELVECRCGELRSAAKMTGGNGSGGAYRYGSWRRMWSLASGPLGMIILP